MRILEAIATYNRENPEAEKLTQRKLAMMVFETKPEEPAEKFMVRAENLLSRLATGRVDSIRFETLKKLCEILHTTSDFLLGYGKG